MVMQGKVKVKICGITNLEDALAAFFSGADAIGFVFYKKSPRYIDPLKARNISRILPKKILKVGVFVDEKERKIKSIVKMCALDMLQFHGSESPEFCLRFNGCKIIKAFRVRDKLELDKVREYKTFAYLFDAFSKHQAGGTGKKFDWNLLPKKSKMKRMVFLSGGLSSANILPALKQFKPDWVDLSSSVEIKPGKKDHKKIRSFIRMIK
ncbi:MAG TPA: phosphoribosylanthranilate isomerase [Candidatus Omnitrophota bacterium]|nr:phosphoribosylanthranilate isomerase [Candidatus Omnitrophota bacterium]